MEGQKFIVIEITYVMDTNPRSWGPVIRIWGRNKAGETVCAKVRDFKPYMYFDYCPKFNQAELNSNLSIVLTSDAAKPPDKQYIYSCGVVERTCIMGYQPKGRMPYYKLTMTAPTQIATVRKYFEALDVGTYEANIAYVLRFMIDCDFGGCHWISFTNIQKCKKETKTTHEFEASYRNISVDKDDQDLGAIRIMSYDIEACKFGARGFVDCSEDPVTQIGCSIETIDRTVVDESVFCLVEEGQGVTTPLENPAIRVIACQGEPRLFQSFGSHIDDYEVDIITGYNVDGFDHPYVFGRVKALCLKDGQFTKLLSRDYDKSAYVKKAFFSSAAKGVREDYQLMCQGRFSMDTMKFIKEILKLRSYRLGYVAEELTGQTKVDMPYKLIPEFQKGTDDQRAHLSYYCWQDAKLCLELLDKRKAGIMYIQNARVCGVPWRFLVERGQQVLSHGLVARYCRPRHFIIPSGTEEQNDEETKGATVKEPKVGFYKNPVITLDFQSLYPSIIRARNICYSTLCKLSWARKNLKPSDYWVPPVPGGCDYCFVKEHIHKGILSEIETTLFLARNDAKGLKKQHEGTDLEVVYDKLQEALKIRMNSLYGFTKADTLCAKELMEAICAEGRWMLDATTEIVETNFEGSEVIYGDTDSVFVCFGDVSLEKAFELGQKAAEMCTDFLTKIRTDEGLEPIHLLQREKGFQPFLLCGKKRYVGRKTLAPGKPFKMASSGMETVRRDNAKIGSGTMEVCLENIIMKGDWDAKVSIAYVHQAIRDLLMGYTPMSQLIISKALSKSKKHYEESSTKQVHSELAKRIEERSPFTGEEPYHTGDRVKFVMVKGLSKSKAYERSEDPLFALRERIPIDYTYYVENQMMKPLLRIFTPILAPHEKLKKYNSKGDKVPLNQKELEALTAYKVLFVGDHMRQMVQKMPKTGGMMNFVKRSRRCFSCNCGHDNDSGVCKACESKAEGVQKKLMEGFNQLEDVRSGCLQTCRTCVKNQEWQEFPPCSNNDCDNFFRREKVLVDLEDLGDKLKLFQ